MSTVDRDRDYPFSLQKKIFIYSGISLVLFTLPLFAPAKLYSALTVANIMAAFAMSWDVLAGYTGLISFGHALFFGFGGYTSALLNLRWEWPLFLCIPAGPIIALIAALVLVAPSLRLRGPYFSLITLLTPIIALRLVSAGTSDTTGGVLGLAGVEMLAFDERWAYIITLIFMLLTFVVLKILMSSKIGRVLEAIREDEDAAEAVGINVRKYKILALMLSASIAGMCGSLLVHHYTVVSPSKFFGFDLCIEPIIMTILGGIGTIIGPLVGAFFLNIVQEYLRAIGSLRLFVFALATLVCLYFMPKGIVPTIVKIFKRK